MQLQEIWRQKSDEELLEAAARVHEYTDDGQRAIMAEVQQRNLSIEAVSETATSLAIDARTKARRSEAFWARVAIVGLSVALLLNILSALRGTSAFDAVQREVFVDFGTTDVEFPLALQRAISVTATITGIVFLVWLHRAYGNLTLIGAPGGRTAGWVIACWFIPIVGFVVPQFVIGELWGKSQIDDHTGKLPRVPPLVNLWWLTFMLWIVLQGGAADMVDAPARVSGAAGTAAAALAIGVVRGIDLRQRASLLSGVSVRTV